MEKKLMLGNEAIARGLYEAGVKVISSYPGTPSTEISEYAAKYDEMYAEWAPNEKVACEVAFGAATGGVRSFCAMKHVGLNVAADPTFTAAYIGVNGGMVICVADDPGMHSSQNEQDSRHYAQAAKIPMLEPTDSQECKDFVKKAYAISEKYDTPVFLRLSTRISHSQGLVTLEERVELPVKEYVKNPAKNVMMPAMARGRHIFVEDRMARLRSAIENCPINPITDNGSKIGVIAAGTTYQYANEALGNKVNYLKLGMVFPLPSEKIVNFAKGLDKIYVLEELDPVIENHCKTLGIDVIGKDKFSLLGEYTDEQIAEVILGEKRAKIPTPATPIRPPVMCPGCPHRAVFYMLGKLKATVFGDIGCYTLGALSPLNAIDVSNCMGSGISSAHGFEKARGTGKNIVSVIGDSTFMHSGITSLMDIAYNKGTSTVLILDNSITGMTGHQQNPATGLTLQNEKTTQVDFEGLVKALGISRFTVVDPFDLPKLEAVLTQEMNIDEPSVIVAQRPCALLKTVKFPGPIEISADKCKSCGMCMKIGCPAITMKDNKATIDKTLCNGCGLCKNVCKFDAIGGKN